MSSMVLYEVTKTQKAKIILDSLITKYPEVTPQLDHSNILELLFATILSAQSTDKRVNIVTPALFSKYPTLNDYVSSDINEIASIIKSVGLYNTKAKYIQDSAKMLITQFGGSVPDNMDDLLTLPGVSRKTASVVLWQGFGKNEGFTVDTHVIRLSYWFGLTDSKDPGRIEADLCELFPRQEWGNTSLRLIFLGREVLTARNPRYQDTEWEPLLVKDRINV